MGKLKGFRTFLLGFVLMVAPTALNYLAGVDWTSLGISPGAGAVIGSIIMVLRTVTDTPVFKSIPK